MPEEPVTDAETEEPEVRRRPLATNVISEIGVVIAIIALINIVFLVYVDVTAVRESPYIGILAYIGAPSFLVAGIILFIIGIFVERRRRRRVAPDVYSRYPVVNLNDPHTRRVLELSSISGAIFLVITLLGSYQAYEFTDSDQFCGQLCHKVMNPEYTAYKQSPHARVGCVNCHVGAGATWYVKSKLSGSYQVYSALFNKYPRPIPTPVESLRPARQTCEQCHWPERFFGAQLKVFNHFSYDETNTPRETRMLIKTGGGSPTGGLTAGIHWHMNIANKIEYYASDGQRQKIDYIRLTDRAGHVTEYFAQDAKQKPEQLVKQPVRAMDCIDCHNRPTHIYVPPDRSVDRALLAGRIDRTLPFVKATTVDALSGDYTSTPQALNDIATKIRGFYSTKYPQVYASKRAAVDAVVKESQNIFSLTRFPEMKVDWRTHPDNVGHFYSQGCFRCHDNQHTSKDGKTITKDCHACHDILGQKVGSDILIAIPNSSFTHPVDLGDLTLMNCADCHTGKPMS